MRLLSLGILLAVLPSQAPAPTTGRSVDRQAAKVAAVWTCVPEPVIVALRRHELGPAGYELGWGWEISGRASKFAKAHFKPQHRQYVDGARQINKILWAWVAADKTRMRRFLADAAKEYHKGEGDQAWAKSVYGCWVQEAQLKEGK